MKIPGPEAIRLLGAVGRLCLSGEIAVAQIRDLARELGKSRVSVAKALNGLKKLGYAENPIWGGWRLTRQGRELLASLTRPFDPKRMAARLDEASDAFEFLYEIREAVKNAR